ncbi:hypothetical protein DFJ74DRAFT_670545 [Hyaloraphidium curvatum]|nr:hypothetical protein DFJ74DRAFT_670545 [Hyaloraphidium curvatum]
MAEHSAAPADGAPGGPPPRWTPRREPSNPGEILLAALKSSGRSALIAYSARAFLTLLLRAARGRFSKGTLREVFGGDEALRFARMFGTFTFLFKAINGLGCYAAIGRVPRRASLREPAHLAPAAPGDKAHLSLRSPEFVVASVSGAVAGLAALKLEKPDERLGWAQQFFVRGMQCLVVFLARERNIYVPHGDSLVFILSCAQIMYAYILRPSTIPPAYYTWMVRTARVPHDVLEVNRRNIRYLDTLDRVKFGLPPESGTAEALHAAISAGAADPIISKDHILAVARGHHSGPTRYAKLAETIEAKGLPLPIVPCELLHAEGEHGCLRYNAGLFNKVFWEIARVYAALNVVPLIVFGSRRLMKEPLKVALRLVESTARSSTFLAVYVTSYMLLACLLRNLHLANLLTRDHKGFYYLFGIVSACSIFIEREGRRGELAAYVLPKAAESAWRVWADRGVLPRWIPGGDFALFGAGMGLLMGFYQTAPGNVSGLLYALMRRVVA